MSTITLADLLEINGPSILTIMKKITKDPKSEIFMNENFEWCIKSE